MREGKPSQRFGARGLHNINLGGGDTPLLLKLYGPNDEVLAILTEEKGECIDPGYVDFFLGPNCRPAKYQRYLVEKLPDGTTGVLHDNPQVLAHDFDAWVKFLDNWVGRHEHTVGTMEQVNDCTAFDYQLLRRLKQDCDYYLGHGQRHKKHLWALDEAEQIQKMKKLYAELPEKPEWITLADIEKYEAEMVSSVDATLADGKPAKTPSMGM